MALIQGILQNTPVWVWVLFVYLVIRGVKAMKPGETTLLKLAIIPVVLTLWSVVELVRMFELNARNLSVFGLAMLAGIVLGRVLVGRLAITADRERGVLHRPADYTLLPLVLLTFGIKYGFGFMAAVAPAEMQNNGVMLADLAASGLFAGIFVGKFAGYAAAYARPPGPLPAGA